MSLPALPVNMASFPVSIFVFLALMVFSVLGDTCQSPTVKHDVYTTTESTVSEQTVFVVTFSMKCKNNVQDVNLYAELNGETIPASKAEGTGSYQVSFSAPHKALPSGTYPVRIFDEEGYGDLKKAQRSGDNVANIKSLFTINVDHQGASSGPWVDSVFVATCVSGFLVYFAHSHKASLEQS